MFLRYSCSSAISTSEGKENKRRLQTLSIDNAWSNNFFFLTFRMLCVAYETSSNTNILLDHALSMSFAFFPFMFLSFLLIMLYSPKADFHMIAAGRNPSILNRITEPALRLTFISTVPLRKVYAPSPLRGKDGSGKLPGWWGWGWGAYNGLAFLPSRGIEIVPVASCYRNCISRSYVTVSVYKKKLLNFSKSSFPIRFNLLHPHPSSFLFALETPLWCFSSSANHYF